MTQEANSEADEPPSPGSGLPADNRSLQRVKLQLAQMLFQPRMMLGVMLMYAGVGVYVFFRADTSFTLLLERYGSAAVASALALAGFYLFSSEIAKWRILRGSRFVDVDERVRAPSSSVEYERLAARLNELQANIAATRSPAPPRNSADQESSDLGAISAKPNFVLYFDAIRRLLEQKAAVADEKASILLDKGTTYSRFGIMLFIFSIVAWQALSHWTGFQHQYIYGIVSTSLLFVFVEFLSAWFLKQYRQFIDTSTYLIKVKSIFDRYMLVYLASKEAIAEGHDSKKSNHLLLELLRADISWPDTYLTKSPDASFAKEALETMTLLVKSMKSEAKETIRKESAVSGKKAA